MSEHSLITDHIRNILLIQLGDIGDVVLTFPAMKSLRDRFPHAKIMSAVRQKAESLLEDCPWIDGVIAIDQQKRSVKEEIAYQWRFFSDLRKHRFELAIDMRTGTRGAILAFLSGASQRVGFYADDGKLWRNRLFTHLAKIDYRIGQYVGDYYSAILNAYGIKTQSELPRLPVSIEKQAVVNSLLKSEHIPADRPLIAIQPFSLWQYKEWKKENHAALIGQIIAEYDAAVIITGSPNEKERAEEIIRLAKHEYVYNFAGKTSVGMLAALLSVCKLFIGSDSAGIHIAAAVGTPTISIFGPSSSASWAPRGEQHIVVHNKNFSCVPCRNKGCQNTEISRCLDELSVDEVMQALRAQLRKILPR
jgi:heptosyltransferase-3